MEMINLPVNLLVVIGLYQVMIYVKYVLELKLIAINVFVQRKIFNMTVIMIVLQLKIALRNFHLLKAAHRLMIVMYVLAA